VFYPSENLFEKESHRKRTLSWGNVWRDGQMSRHQNSRLLHKAPG